MRTPGVRFFKRAAADSLGMWISSQQGPAHHSRVNLTIQVPTDPPVAVVAAPARILWRARFTYHPPARVAVSSDPSLMAVTPSSP
jgi:hypothetical protein